MLRCGRCVQFFLCLDIVGARGEKKQNLSQKKTCKNTLFWFFLRELLACHLITKFCTRLVPPSILDAKKFHMFLNFLAIFLNLLFTAYRFTIFPLPQVPGPSKQRQNLHAPCTLDYLRSHKISDFFEYFCYFFRIY